ncbi:hypothetical protein [Roseibacillus ishigakijimensis]|uniref:hypothetical protein n=1 Tax=Roseibacillus ishigakijimensis TaxID=454146 RepID=UPI0019040140|nr:hypothetical protein [Roseibacillus ishigakijimensis]
MIRKALLFLNGTLIGGSFYTAISMLGEWNFVLHNPQTPFQSQYFKPIIFLLLLSGSVATLNLIFFLALKQWQTFSTTEQ